ncbi:MAG TPA: GNAT family N-acetyltransferase [Micromonosporaceae bacterium]|jgi:GNAT superfamily N-acetyltransferase|nr:GNAT family N-acetyltransferase [Micromonosporaceae bacterium]
MDERVQKVTERDQGRAYGTLLLAFAADPCERWLYPDAAEYVAHFPRFLEAFGGAAFSTDTAWQLDEFAAVSLWMPPGAAPDGDAIVEVLRGSVAPAKHADLFAVLDQMNEAHPAFAHWYLPWFGTDPSAQGRGRGSALMTHCLSIVDVEAVPVYLETPNPRTIPFYRRHGFDVTGTFQAGACPPLTGMLRPATN